VKTKGLRFFLVLGVLAALFAFGATSAGATGGGGYDLNVDVDAECETYTVSANPANWDEDNTGQSRIQWRPVPGTLTGTGTFAFGEFDSSASWEVSVQYRKYTSSNWGFTWTATSVYHTETDSGSVSRKGHCDVVICHATGSQSNPYIQITVDDRAVDGVGSSDHNRDGHQNGEDIIPPGFWDADGRNWTAEGIAIWENGCEIPEPPPPPVEGCTDPLALNYNPEATVDDGSCEYPPPVQVCEDPAALNYGEEGECQYPPPTYTIEDLSDCDGFAFLFYQDGEPIGGGSGPWNGRTLLYVVLPPDSLEFFATAAPPDDHTVVGQVVRPDYCEPGEPPCPQCVCPTCGPPVQETMGESMGIAWFSDVPCDAGTCPLFAGQDHNPWVKLWTMIPSFFTHEGVTAPLTAVTTANGEVCYEAFFRDGDSIGDFILWGPNGEGDRIRGHFPASDPQPHKYSACSIFPSWCDTRLGEDGQGYALWLPGHTVWDWAQFLLQNGFFPGEENRATLALGWAMALRENGNAALLTWNGDLRNLPPFPLPPR